MGEKRKNHSKEFKAKLALEAVKGAQSLGELAARFKVHPTQIAQWKKQLTENAAQLFERGRSGAAPVCPAGVAGSPAGHPAQFTGRAARSPLVRLDLPLLAATRTVLSPRYRGRQAYSW